MRDITLCHPHLQELATKLVEECKRQGLIIKIGETLRTATEQDELYAQGRTKPGNIVTNARGSSYRSMHQWGVAFDFFRNDGSGAYNETGNFFGRVGQIGKALGLEWGGDWKSIKDNPHFQLPDWGSTPTKLIAQYGTPEAFKRSWNLLPVGWIQDTVGWWYRHEDGGFTSNDWEQIGGKWYWFNGAGYMVESNWYQDNGRWYYLGADGAMVTGLQVIGGKVYYFNGSGVMAEEPVTLIPDDNGALH